MPNIEEIIVYAIVFVVLFLIGGAIGCASLPPFEGRFYISGLVFAIFATGAGTLILKARF
jgi:hypothetical protein